MSNQVTRRQRAAGWTTWCLIGWLAMAGVGCGGAAVDPAAEAEAVYEGCQDGAATATQQLVCDAFAKGLAAGKEVGRARGEAWVARLTEDGYHLRKIASLTLVTLGFWVGGTLLAALWVSRSRPTSAPSHADHVLAALEREADRVRALGGTGDAPTAQVVERIRGPLAETERQARQVANLCRGLEAEAHDATARAQRESYYRKLDQLVGRVERLRVQVGVWQERLAVSDEASLEAEMREAIADLGAAMEELA